MSGTPTILGIPYDGSSSFLRGAADAPNAIRKALRSPSTNGWTEALLDTSDPAAVRDAGDVDFEDAFDPRAAIGEAVSRILDSGGSPISLGGDHSVTFPILRALRPRCPQLTILHFDAHPDIHDTFEGDPYSHACPFARIMESGLCDRLVQAGIRTMNPLQQRQVERFGVEVIDMRSWVSGRRPIVEGPVYVSIDVDGLDPAFAPGVSHPEPGGLSTRDIVTVLQSLEGPIVGADVVEYNPARDFNDLTAYVCAKLVKELVGGMMAPARPRPHAVRSGSD